jgi:peptidoglycan/LPS O-acetylase OafA/YrhL
LDAFRALALLPVLFYHFFTRWAPPVNGENTYLYDGNYGAWFSLGRYGVEFFFIISGFVIFMTLMRCGHVFEFWYRRFARLWPALIVCMVVTLIVTSAIGPDVLHRKPSDLVWSALMLGRYAPGAQWVDGAYWSLLVELKFYFWIGLAFLAGATRFTRTWSIFVLAGVAVWGVGALVQSTTLVLVSKEIFVVDYLPFFTAGIFYFKLYAERRPDWALLLLAGIPYIAIWSGIGFVPGLTNPADADTVYGSAGGTPPLALHAVVGAMGAAFWGFARGGLGWLAAGPLLFIGRISYPLYLLHQFVGVSVIRFVKSAGAGDLVAIAVAAACCFVLAAVVTTLVEGPGKRRLMHFGKRALFPRWPRTARLGYPTASAGVASVA